MKKTFLFNLFLFSSILTSAQNPVGIFSNHVDIGKPKIAGGTIYNDEDQSYNIKGAGYNIWFGRDEFHYAYKKIKGDFILTGNFKILNTENPVHRKTGWMVRSSEDENATHMTAAIHDDGLMALQWRTIQGAYMRDPQDEIFSKKRTSEIIQLERLGKVFIMRIANPGEPLQEVGRTDAIDMPDEVLVGIFMCSHNPEIVEEAKAWNVRIEQTVPDSHNGYQDGILGSKMEIINVFDGKRKVVYEDKGRFEAPNWLPNNKGLLFNQSGKIYTIPFSGGTPKMINTGVASNNNNDHVISFDGKLLGISSHRDGFPEGGSTIYYLPIIGGEPKIVTNKTPSYLHGWTKEGKQVVYTAQRPESGSTYNIYKKRIDGDKEIQLTHLTKGLADGPECSPDGKYIYYNSTQSGTMQLWRMLMDGSEQTQLTFDEYNNWFAHVSPDNKWIAFLSFPNTIDPTDHPFYKRVMIRLMPVSGGGAPRVIAYLYGGQGTMNTRSWSPDSKFIAFVSNSGPISK